MKPNSPHPSPERGSPLSQGGNLQRRAIADAAPEFGRFRILLRQRQLLADGVRVELGTRAFDLLLVLLEADGLLVTKEELLSRVWPGIAVSEENLKAQMCALRKALGAERNLIRTEFGRGYRFTGVLRTNAEGNSSRLTRSKRRPGPIFFPQWCRQSPQCGVDLRS